MNERRRILLLCVLLLGAVTATLAQFRGQRRAPMEYRSRPLDRGNVPSWTLDEKFPDDVFTFARVKYHSSQAERTSFAWWTDYPDADLNLSYRLHQLTALQVNPEPKVVEITDPELSDYPWLFMSGVGNITLTRREAEILRDYLLAGGFMLVDDFWGQAEWDGFYRALKQVFPDREPVDLPRSHRLFQYVYHLPQELSLQTPNVGFAVANRNTGITWENRDSGNTRDVHFRAVLDDRDRIMVLMCHNTDNGDGWEEESTDPWFFSAFSEKKNYPLAINMLVYAMTH